VTDTLFLTTPAWHAAHAGAVCGVLAMRGVTNPPDDPTLDRVREELERDVRERYGGLDRAALREVGLLPAYAAYYKRWGQRYHVAMQLESVAQKGKAIPRVAALVEAMFVAELRHQILTAGHDLDALAAPVRMDSGNGDEEYETPRGDVFTIKPGDMYVADGRGVLSSVIGGPARYGRIGPQTTAALFVAYGVPGVPIEAMAAHLTEMESLVRSFAPAATNLLQQTIVAGP
jgi:DNA/RNA-binding domain of Phe-tRNA-synthetase-like protein